jgi:hypothetical protein
LGATPGYGDQSRSAMPTKSSRGTLALLHEHGIIAGRCWPDADGGEAQRRHPGMPIRWISDRLPGLEAIYWLGFMFKVIWLSAVWMQVAPGERTRAPVEPPALRAAGEPAPCTTG